MPEVRETFHRLTGALDYSMFIVTAVAGRELAGCLVGFATQCSIDPQRFLVCLSDKNRTFRVASRGGALAVHFVASDAPALVELFGSETGDDVDKFERCAWHPGPAGLPILEDCRRWFAGPILERHVLGDHVGFVLAPVAAELETPERDFPFHRAKRLEPGHEA
jgi:flavin reductase (DIM6/NTAB) family NADH-FMN oxidoreductase RutF